MSNEIVTSCRLYYKDGSSDKEYHASLNAVDGGYTVTFAFGRRGNALAPGTKTTMPVPLEQAQLIYDKLISEKQAKGYTPDGSGTAFAQSDYEARKTGLHPQLLNSVEEQAARGYLADDAWCMQEKYDGKRIMISTKAGIVEGSNRKGLSVAMPQEIADALAPLSDCVLDGELIGGGYVVFDALELNGTDLRSRPYRERHDILTATLAPSSLTRIAETAWDAAGKEALYRKIAQSGGEGVVFKRCDSRSIAGRPASGGSQVKCKFYATCTCVVTAQNPHRSVRLHLLNEAGASIGVGNVTIPANKAIPPAGALVEIRYLYAYKGGSLYQPAYLGERDDFSLEDCVLSQLKYKPEGDAAED